MGRNLLFEEVDIFNTDDLNDLKIYRYAIVGLEVLSFIVMCLSLKFMNKTIDVFSLNEFDLIRNNFTDDFISKV